MVGQGTVLQDAHVKYAGKKTQHFQACGSMPLIPRGIGVLNEQLSCQALGLHICISIQSSHECDMARIISQKDVQ